MNNANIFKYNDTPTLSSVSPICLTDLARVVQGSSQQNGVKMEQNRLFERLRKSNLPMPMKLEKLIDIPSKRWDKVPSVVDREEEAEEVDETTVKEAVEEDKKMHIQDKIYKSIAKQVLEKIDDNYDNYLSGLECEVLDGDRTYKFFLTAIIYRNANNEITDLIPVWRELHSYIGEDMQECFNDFSFKKFVYHIL